MKFYRYKQVQRLTFFGYDDILKTDVTSFSNTSSSTVNANIRDTKLVRFDINKIASIQLSQNARIVLESIFLPNIFGEFGDRETPVTVRMNNLSSNSYDSENKGYNSTLIYTCQTTGETFTNTSNELFYNFSIDQNFFKNGYIELQITYPNMSLNNLDFIDKFYISFVVYDINEEELLLKDTPDVDYNNFRAHYNNNNGRIPK